MAVCVQRMALSLLSSSSSLSILTSSFHVSSSPFPFFSSSIQQTREILTRLALCSRNCSSKNGVFRSYRSGIPISSALATDSSGSSSTAATLSSTGKEGERVSSESKVVLPTNESSERLLRIRHTLRY